MILTKESRLVDANQYLEKAIRIDGRRTNTRFNLALNEFRLGSLESAVRNLETVLRDQPGHSPATLLLGTILARKGECKRAIAMLESVQELTRRQPDSVCALAGCYYVAGNRDMARQTFGALANQPQEAEWIAAGLQVASQAHDPETVDTLLAVAHAQYPNDRRWNYAEALAQYNTGRFAESEATLEGAIAAGAAQADVFDLLAWCRHRQGHEAEASKAIQQAVDLEPNNAIRYSHQAQMLLEQKNYPEAFVSAQKAADLSPSDAAAWRIKATIEFAMSMFRQTAASAAKAVELDPGNPDSLLLLGAAQEKLFRYAEARVTFEKGIRLFPDQVRFSVDCGKLLLDPGAIWTAADLAKGAAFLETALARDGSRWEAHLALGQFLLRTGSASRALPHLSAAAKLNPQDAQAHLLLASAYRLVGRPADAAVELQRYRTLHP
jgi:tetratricopeptide (TPR) repeat protein